MTVEEEGYDLQPDSAEECVDLVQQLHGILAGGMPIRHTPRMK
jgi:hypothetical protein